MKVPDKSEFPGTGPDRQRHLAEREEPGRRGSARSSPAAARACHQLGTKGTREISAGVRQVPVVELAAWERRVQSGQAGAADDRHARPARPPARARDVRRLDRPHRRTAKCRRRRARPQGIERNVVITEWDWADPKAYLHDVVSTDRRNPTLNANGLIYGVARAERRLSPVLDPVRNASEPGAAHGARSEHSRSPGPPQ